MDMAKNSATYIFTQTPEADEAAISYIRKEWAERRDFLEVWDVANESLMQVPDIPRGLRREHVIAIRAHSQESRLYREFNAAMNDTIYQVKFHFKSFHCFLSVGMRKLKEKKQVNYRGAQMLFNATEGEKVRLGQIAPSSSEESEAIGFLEEMSSENTLFEIKTRFGVPISELSYFPDEEGFRIPPIEVFKVQSAPVLEKNASQSCIKITLAARRCQGFTMTVQTRNGALEVKRGKGKCPKRCRCIQG